MAGGNDVKLLDLCCGAGGAARGYHDAGFDDITGVDIEPQPHYPYKFIQGDALDYCRQHGHEYDVIHASPPCQTYSLLAFAPHRDMSSYPALVAEFRELLVSIGKPYVIENVPTAPLGNPIVLCGTMFGLPIHRHRAFECNPPVYFLPAGCNGARVKPIGSGKRLGQYYGADAAMVTVAGHLFSRESGSRAMGIDWMTRDELAESVPPVFTEYVGQQLLAALEAS